MSLLWHPVWMRRAVSAPYSWSIVKFRIKWRKLRTLNGTSRGELSRARSLATNCTVGIYFLSTSCWRRRLNRVNRPKEAAPGKCSPAKGIFPSSSSMTSDRDNSAFSRNLCHLQNIQVTWTQHSATGLVLNWTYNLTPRTSLHFVPANMAAPSTRCSPSLSKMSPQSRKSNFTPRHRHIIFPLQLTFYLIPSFTGTFDK